MPALCQCEFRKVFWMPNLEKAERLLIAIMMVCDDPAFAEIRMTGEKDRIFHFHPLADFEFLEHVFKELGQDIKHPLSLARFRDKITDWSSNALQFSMPTGLLTDDPAAEFERLANRYLVTPRLPAGADGVLKAEREDERRRLYREMAKTFKKYDVWKHMLKSIPMRDYVPNLRTRIDCGYRALLRTSDGRAQFKMFHALNVGDRDSVARLVDSYPAFRLAISNEMKVEPVLFAITRDWELVGDRNIAEFEALTDTGINHLSLSDLPSFAKQARRDLGLLDM